MELVSEPILARARIRNRQGNRLTAATVRQARKPGKWADGNGLWLIVDAPERRYWRYRYQWEGRTREMSLGSADKIGLVEARAQHAQARLLVERGIDPLDRRRGTVALLKPPPEKPGRETFAFAAAEYLDAHEAGWKNPKHRQQWRNTLESASKLIGTVPIRTLGTDDVLRVLNPIWKEKPETASRLRGRIEAVIDYATVREWRDRGPNPAVWNGHLEHVLAAKGKLAPTESHPALPWREAPSFMVALREQAGMGALALQFAILTAVRSGEARGARWDEIDLETGIWTIPAARMKAGREHRVPLSRPALMILLRLAKVADGSGLIFFGREKGKMLSDMSLTAVLRRMGRDDVTAHGFRSTFRDWVADNGKPGDAGERALAHVIRDKTRGAYERTDLFDMRRGLMNDWAAFVAPPAAVLAAAA